MTLDPVSKEHAKKEIQRLLDDITRLETFSKRIEGLFPELFEDVCWDDI